jgi:NDP-sugar pyrophosphorylase family protein
MAIPFDNYFIDIGVPEDFYKAQKELPSFFYV